MGLFCSPCEPAPPPADEAGLLKWFVAGLAFGAGNAVVAAAPAAAASLFRLVARAHGRMWEEGLDMWSLSNPSREPPTPAPAPSQSARLPPTPPHDSDLAAAALEQENVPAKRLSFGRATPSARAPQPEGWATRMEKDSLSAGLPPVPDRLSRVAGAALASASQYRGDSPPLARGLRG